MATDTPSSYRPDIDGLRAVAVLLVMGFHAFPGRVPGGLRRRRRLLRDLGIPDLGAHHPGHPGGDLQPPALLCPEDPPDLPGPVVLLVVCLLVGGIVLTPTEYADLGWNAAAGAAFVSNLALWAQSGYFAAAAELKPLLHLWSLGVEEQFYFAWPLTLVFLFARTKRPWIAVAGIALLSFALNIYWVSPRPDAAFYSPLTRLWELLIGGLLAYRAERIRSGATPSRAPPGSLVPGASRNAVSLLGLVLVAVAAMAFDGSQPFPGWRAAVPVVGTALCIAAGREAWINRVVLAHPVPVFFGLISYPLYLWHWPTLALIPILDIAWSASQERALKLLALGVAVIAAYLTYRWVERPIRRGNVGSIRGSVRGHGRALPGGDGDRVRGLAGPPGEQPPAARDRAPAGRSPGAAGGVVPRSAVLPRRGPGRNGVHAGVRASRCESHPGQRDSPLGRLARGPPRARGYARADRAPGSLS